MSSWEHLPTFTPNIPVSASPCRKGLNSSALGRSANTLNMNGFSSSSGETMFVQALYDYEADDQTSLSFRAGDIIHVITQLESGWWDGYINGVRGWFPSNYCQLINSTATNQFGQAEAELTDQESLGPGSQDELENIEYEDVESDGNISGDGINLRPVEANDIEQEEAAFWIPQATPDGRLYYYNTLTGVSRTDLPLESFSVPAESGPRGDRNNLYLPDMTRPPPESRVAGYEQRDEEMDHDHDRNRDVDGDADADADNSSSDVEPQSRSSMNQTYTKRISTDSDHRFKFRADHAHSYSSIPALAGSGLNGLSNTSFTGISGGPLFTPMSRQLFDDGHVQALTWTTLLDDITSAVQRFRFAVEHNHRSDIVRRAENISDYLRLLLAAGSGTTDNHSGNPSIISSNKALYPIFRETMSRFSKLVLSSHIAAADYPPLDAHAKCLKEAGGMMSAVYGFINVARKQRGEEIPRVIPGFVSGSYTGGGWRNNGLNTLGSPPTLSLADQDDYDLTVDPVARLDAKLVERLEDLLRGIQETTGWLDEHLVLPDKLISPSRHKQIGDGIAKSCSKVVEVCRTFIGTIESINLSPLCVDVVNTQIRDYNIQKQTIYDTAIDLVIACQAVSSPLADEWADAQKESLEDRMNMVNAVLQKLAITTAQMMQSIRAMAEMMPHDQPTYQMERTKMSRNRTISNASRRTDDPLPVDPPRGGAMKLQRIFGEVPPIANTITTPPLPPPPPPPQQAFVEDIPDFLTLDHENEITYDLKTTPPQLRGGTLTGLVEQLTRHDRHNSDFNNTFLLTYKSFTNAEDLFHMLVKRWGIQPPYGLSQEDYQTWTDQKQKPIQFRVVNILKTWLDTYWMEPDSEETRYLLQRIFTFAKDHVATTNTPGAAPLSTAVEQRLKGEQQFKRLVLTQSTHSPTPILPRNMRRLKFLDIDYTEFARQLTVIESRLYGKIKPIECLNKTWNKAAPDDNSPHPAANLKAVILHANQLTSWVAKMILSQGDVKRRCIVIKHFVLIADKCRQFNNFSTLTSIISAFGTAPIHRLHRTWKEVKGNTKETLESLRKLMGSTKNFAEYRETLHKAHPPCTPFLGVYLTDLTFIEDGIPSNLKKNNLINFAKRAKTAEVIRDIQQYQNVPYSLQPVAELQEFIATNMKTAGDVAGMYEISLQVEPREREEDRVARQVDPCIFARSSLDAR